MNQLLQESASVLAHWLETQLATIDQDWWDMHVVRRLTPQQQSFVEEQSIDSLSGLDLAAILRVLDQNWNEIGGAKLLGRDARTWVKELQGVRNRWAHPPAGGIGPKDAYRDADTLGRLLKSVGADSALLQRIESYQEVQLPPPPAVSTLNSPEPKVQVISPTPIPQPSSTQHREKAPGANPMTAPDHSTSFAAEPPRAAAKQPELESPAEELDRWRSRTKNADYMNCVIDAYVENVTRVGNKIHLTYIDSKGESRQVHDFGIKNGFVSRVFDHLSNHMNRRAVFIVTKKEDEPLMLASDTMMLETYRDRWNA